MVFAWAVAVFLAGWNNVANLLPVFRRRYVPINLLVAAVLLVAARGRGLTLEALGLGVGDLPAGLAWGAGTGLVVAVGLSVALVVPRLRPLLRDPRVDGLSRADLAGLALLRIPLGTVLLEEVAFRGVLLAAWAREQPLLVAVGVSSVVFGLWHIVPTKILTAERGGRNGTVAAGVALTALAGALFCWLRIVSGSLVAPVLLHLATNSLGALIAWVATVQEGDRQPR